MESLYSNRLLGKTVDKDNFYEEALVQMRQSDEYLCSRTSKAEKLLLSCKD